MKPYPSISNVFSLVVLFLSINCSLAAGTHYDWPKGSSAVLLDTVPDSSSKLDTTIILDLRTFEEHFVVETIDNQKLLGAVSMGKMATSIDTSVIFDPETYKESVVIAETSVPENYGLHGLSRDEAISSHGSSSTITVESHGLQPIIPLHFERGHQGFVGELMDSSGKVILVATVPPNRNLLDLGKGNKFDPGSYQLKRNDGGRMVEITLK